MKLFLNDTIKRVIKSTDVNKCRETNRRRARPRGQRRAGSHNKPPHGAISAHRKQQITLTNPASECASTVRGGRRAAARGRPRGGRFGRAPTLKRLVTEVRAARLPFSSTLLRYGLTRRPQTWRLNVYANPESARRSCERRWLPPVLTTAPAEETRVMKRHKWSV